MAYAPGRVEVLGNHTDYNGGTVLSAAIDMGTCFAISPAEDPSHNELRVYAGNRREQTGFALGEVGPVPGPDWTGYIRGVFHYIAGKGYPIGGWNCSFYGDLPVGSGLSSSTALVVSASYAAQAMLGIELAGIEVAKICQAAEHNFVGVTGGLLDQFSSIFGEEHHLIHSDFSSNEVCTVQIPDDIRFLLITSDLRHRLADSPYNERRASCEEAAATLAELMNVPNPDNFTLRDVDMQTFRLLKHKLPAEAAQRAEHVIGEIHRVDRGCSALEEHDISSFGELMFQSHESSRIHFENSTPELDFVVDSARKAGALGARLSGGGWGGSLIAMVHENQAGKVERDIAEACEKEGLTVQTSLVTPSVGARLIVPLVSS